jgi:DNA helicase-2/ATP-dependent DNA helicase PcrA
MAVLARTNTQVGVICQVLRRAGVPFRSVAPADDIELPDEERDPGPHAERVTVCSFHRAKGLQWQAVWVCGLEAGLVPIAYASNSAALAEERRLLYVALTRSERELYCSWARERRYTNGPPQRREPSPWLGALSAHCAGTGAEGQQPKAAPDAALLDFFSSARRRLSRTKAATTVPAEAADPARDALAERLRDWRRRLARASGVPPFVLLHDSTVQAIASRKPVTTAELLTVPGLGPVKVARYGPAILELVQAC